LSILSALILHFSEAYPIFLHLLLYRVRCFPFLLYLLWTSCMHCFLFPFPFLFNFNIWVLPFEMFNISIPETFDFFYCLISPYSYFIFYPTSHYSTQQHFKFVFGNWFPLLLLILVFTITGQVPKLLTASTLSSIPFF